MSKQHGVSRYWSCLAAFLVILCIPIEAAATSTFSNPTGPLTRFIWKRLDTVAGATYTIETRNRTAGGDPVMHLLNSGATAQVAFDDDGAGNLNSRIVFTAPTTNSYWIWVHSYSNTSSGSADLFINNVSELTQNQFGGHRTTASWIAGQEVRATGTTRSATATNDTMLFLLGSTVSEYRQFDDDSGPGAYAYLTANAAQNNGIVIMGLYPGRNGDAHLSISDIYNFNGVDNDFDNDGVVDPLESLVGSSTSTTDSDNDGIPDSYELFGNEGWSMSENPTPDTHLNPTMRNIYVEADWMPASGAPGDFSKQPYAAMVTDVANLFTNQMAGFAAGQRISMDVRISNSVPFTQRIALYDAACPAGDANCVHFNTLKATHFRPGDSVYRLFAHYAVFANALGDSDLGGCTSGRAEFLGNDLVVTLPQRDTAGNLCPWTGTQIQQRGTFVHELGHNINLTHNLNDRADGQNSSVHASVMNYRWQTNPAAGSPVTGAHLSHGGGGCAACATSPKWVCVLVRTGVGCGGSGGATCDCDLNEWGSLNADFFEGTSFGDGSPGGSAGTGYPLGETPAAAAARRRNGSAKDLEMFTETRPLPRETAAAKRGRVEKRVETLKARGLELGRDFVRSQDGEHIYSVCQ